MKNNPKMTKTDKKHPEIGLYLKKLRGFFAIFANFAVIELSAEGVRDRKEISCTFLAIQHLHMHRCKSLKTNKLTADLRLAYEALYHQK